MMMMMIIMKPVCRRAGALTLLLLSFSATLTAATADAQTKTPYRYTSDLITVNAFVGSDLSTVEMTGARVIASDYRSHSTRLKFTMDSFTPNIDFVKATLDPIGDVLNATMTDGPTVARCIFRSSREDSFVSKTFTRLIRLDERLQDADSIFCYKLTPLMSPAQIVLFIEFEDGTEAITLSEMVMGVSSTIFASRFRRKVDDTGSRDVKRIALVETLYPDTLCSVRLGPYAPEPEADTFKLDEPLMTPVVGVSAINCESNMAF